MVQWVTLCASTAGGAGSIPGRETKIPHAAGHALPPDPKKTIVISSYHSSRITVYLEFYVHYFINSSQQCSTSQMEKLGITTIRRHIRGHVEIVIST